MATAAHAPDGKLNSRQWPLAAIRDTLAAANREALLAWGIWAILTLAGLCFVTIYGLPFPFGIDEWRWIGQATGNEPVTFAWLWSQHNEHRMFLPRLIYLGLGSISGFDFRLGCYFNVFMLSGLSLAMMKAARALRGKTCLCDAFFPLVLLHWGQFDNLIWGFQLNFVTSVVLEGTILLIVLRCGSQISLKSVVLVTLCLVLLGLCGSYGLVFLPPMACWLFYAAACKWLSGGSRAKQIALVMLVFAAMPAALVWMYIQGLSASPEYMGLYASLRTGIEFISFGIGPAAKEIWPVSGFLILIVCAIIVRQCLMVFRNQPAQRLRAAGFLMFFAGIFTLATAIGFGRAYIGPMGGFETRYITLSAPLLLLVFFLYEVHGSPAMKHHVPRILFALMSVLFVINTQKGISYSRNLWKQTGKFEQDMRDGISAEAMGMRYAEQWGHEARELIPTRLVWLQTARLGLYRSSAPRSGQAVRVERIWAGEPATEKIEPVGLAAGQSFARPFSVREDGELRRIDVQVHIGREARSLRRLDWTLFENAADGKANILAADHIDPADADGDDYISIPLAHVYARKTQEFVLQLAIPSGALPTACVEIPLYEAAENKKVKQIIDGMPGPYAGQSAGHLRGFIYLECDGPSIPLIARRPGGNY
ncbi:MAG: hypothetical protein ABSG67_12870 [Thermoguttaceae bacterium]